MVKVNEKLIWNRKNTHNLMLLFMNNNILIILLFLNSNKMEITAVMNQSDRLEWLCWYKIKLSIKNRLIEGYKERWSLSQTFSLFFHNSGNKILKMLQIKSLNGLPFTYLLSFPQEGFVFPVLFIISSPDTLKYNAVNIYADKFCISHRLWTLSNMKR